MVLALGLQMRCSRAVARSTRVGSPVVPQRRFHGVLEFGAKALGRIAVVVRPASARRDHACVRLVAQNRLPDSSLSLFIEKNAGRLLVVKAPERFAHAAM